MNTVHMAFYLILKQQLKHALVRIIMNNQMRTIRPKLKYMY